MAVNVLFWKPLACFDTLFNKMVATMTLVNTATLRSILS